MQFLEMGPDALWDERGPTWLWALGLYNFPHETVGEAKIKRVRNMLPGSFPIP